MADDFIAHFMQFQKNLEKIGIKSPDANFFSRFLEDDARKYHNYQHIVDLRLLHARLFKQTNMTNEEATWVDLAIWWHDIIYDPRRTDNEETSAMLFKHFYQYVHDSHGLTYVHTTIIDTRHLSPPILRQPWSLYMLDLDLAGLGSYYETYELNGNRIKEEYMLSGQVRESTFVKGRINFLKTMLTKGPVYHNPYNLDFYKKAEVQANKNMSLELALLEQDLANFN